MFNADQRNNRANKITSLIKCRILDSDGEQFSWNKFRMLSKDIATCAKRVMSIRTDVLVSSLLPRGQDNELMLYLTANCGG
jgi:hypothetical protein